MHGSEPNTGFLAGDCSAALPAFDCRDYTNGLGLRAHAHIPADIDQVLRSRGWRRDRWYGVRVLSDHRDDPAPAADTLAVLLAVEREAGRRDPYRQVAALLHLVYSRDGPGARASGGIRAVISTPLTCD